MKKKIVVLASVLGLTSVIFGAFGAHGLKSLISSESIQSFETGVRYQMYHALLLFFVAQTTMLTTRTKQTIYYLILVGVILFSGSIYGLATNALTTFNFKMIAFITPIGGLLLIIAWLTMLVGFIKFKKN